MARTKHLWLAGSCFVVSLATLQACGNEAPAPSPAPPGAAGTTAAGGSSGSGGGSAAGTGGTPAGGTAGSGGDVGGTAGASGGSAGGVGAAGGTDSGGTGGASGGTAGGGGSGGGGASQICMDYCTENATACGTQFATDYPGGEAECLSTCATWPEGGENDSFGMTAGCRLWHTRNVANQGAGHCEHAKKEPTEGCVDI